MSNYTIHSHTQSCIMSSGILAPPKCRCGHPTGHPKLLQPETPLTITKQKSQNSHTIRGLPEKPYSLLTGRPSKTQIILSYNKGANRKQQHCASAIGHVQYHNFIYNNHNSHNTIATLILTMVRSQVWCKEDFRRAIVYHHYDVTDVGLHII